MNNNLPMIGKIFRHYKGGYYKVLAVAKHTEENYNLIVYQGEDGKIWARSLKQFLTSDVHVDGDWESRFRLVPFQDTVDVVLVKETD